MDGGGEGHQTNQKANLMSKILTDISDSLITIYSQINIDTLGTEGQIKHSFKTGDIKKHICSEWQIFQAKVLDSFWKELFISTIWWKDGVVTEIIQVIFNKLKELLLIKSLNVKY